MTDKIRKLLVLDRLTDAIIRREVKLYGSNQSEVVRRIIIEWNRLNNPEPVTIGGEDNGHEKPN